VFQSIWPWAALLIFGLPWVVLLILGLVALIGTPSDRRAEVVLALATLARSIRRGGGKGLGSQSDPLDTRQLR
jgi:hypothetical protein